MKKSSPCDLPMIYGKKIELYGATSNNEKMMYSYNKSIRIAGSCKILKYNLYSNQMLSFAYKKIFYIALSLALILAPIGALRPYLINIGVNQYIMENDISGLLVLCGFIIGLVIFEALFGYYFRYLTDVLGLLVTKDLRIRIFNKIVSQRVRQFDQTPTGIYITRIINDIESRIAELFQERLKKGATCITDEDVNAIIKSMGRPEEFEGETEVVGK